MNYKISNTNYCLSAFLLTTLWLSCLTSAGELATVKFLSWTPLTVTDFKNNKITINLPLQRIVVLDAFFQITMATRALGIENLIVGIDQRSAKNKTIFPEGSWCDTVGTCEDPDMKKICDLDPDLVLTGNLDEKISMELNQAGLSVASISVFPNRIDGFEPTEEINQALEMLTGNHSGNIPISAVCNVLT